jgi:hypothetical protein
MSVQAHRHRDNDAGVRESERHKIDRYAAERTKKTRRKGAGAAPSMENKRRA